MMPPPSGDCKPVICVHVLIPLNTLKACSKPLSAVLAVPPTRSHPFLLFVTSSCGAVIHEANVIGPPLPPLPELFHISSCVKLPLEPSIDLKVTHFQKLPAAPERDPPPIHTSLLDEMVPSCLYCL